MVEFNDHIGRPFLASATALLGIGAAAAQPQEQAATYPSRPVTIILPFAAGGAIHFVARLMAVRLSRLLKQPVTVENRPGQGGVTGSCVAAEAAPDGHTLLLAANGTYAIEVNITPCRTDFTAAFVPIGLLTRSPQVLCVAEASPFRTLEQLVAAAWAAPGAIRYITQLAHSLTTLFFADSFEISVTGLHVGGAVAGLDAMARGEAEFAFLALGDALPQTRAGRMRALAIAARERAPQLPEVPTLEEAGMPGFTASSDLALFAPAGTPEAILARLAEASMAALRQGDTAAMLAPIGVQVMAGARADFPDYFKAENEKWLRLIRQFDIRALEGAR